MGNLKELTKGLIKENPTCGTSWNVSDARRNNSGRKRNRNGACDRLCSGRSNIVISLLKRIIPKAVKLPCYIVIIAGFVTLISFLLHGFIPSLYDALGTFLNLITVNCIILGRAEMFACKNKVIPSALDGLGMGLGFTLALFAMGSIREIFGSGSWMGIELPFISQPMSVFIMSAGGFFVLGVLLRLSISLPEESRRRK